MFESFMKGEAKSKNIVFFENCARQCMLIECVIFRVLNNEEDAKR